MIDNQVVSYCSVYHEGRRQYIKDGISKSYGCYWIQYEDDIELVNYIRPVYKLSHRSCMRKKQLDGSNKPLVGEIWLARISYMQTTTTRELKYNYVLESPNASSWHSTDNLKPQLWLFDDINPLRKDAIVRLFVHRLWLLNGTLPNDIFREITGYIMLGVSSYKVVPKGDSFIII